MKRNLIILVVAVILVVALFLFVGNKVLFGQYKKAEMIFNKAVASLKENKIEDAIKSYQFIISNYPKAKNTPQALYNLARIYKTEGQFQQAKDTFTKLMEDYPDSQVAVSAWEDINDMNLKLLFSSTATWHSTQYEVKEGDSLAKIAKEFNTTVELIKRTNNLKSDRIIPAAKLKLITGKFSIIIDKSQNILTLKLDEDVLKTYRVATGKDNHTPTGSFKIINKLKSPVWFKAGSPEPIPADSPENILGTRWMGISTQQTGYGIHGTTDPSSIGGPVTEGCVRMHNQDVEELFDLVAVGTDVTIVE